MVSCRRHCVCAASFTDYLDGYLARKWNLVTDFGKFADPLADKLLTTVAFLYMMRDGVCSIWVVAVILAREFAVAGVRMVAAAGSKVIAANMWGQGKTVLQMVTIIYYYFAAALAESLRMPWPSASSARCCAGWWPQSRLFPASNICGTTAGLSTRQNR